MNNLAKEFQGGFDVFTADAHADTLYSLAIERKAPEACAISCGRLERGSVGLQTFALFAGPNGVEGRPYQNGVYMLKMVPQLGVEILKGRLPEDVPDSPKGIVSIEGGEMLEGSIDRLHEFYDSARVRMINLTWNYENQIAYPASGGTKEKIKPFGRELIREMDRLGILVDGSHLNDAGFFDAAERTSLPIIASHSNARWLCEVPRNLTKDQVKVIIEKKGFIGINFYSRFLVLEGQAAIEDVIRHIDAICEMGGIDVLGFGSDFDGIEAWPDGLGNPGDFPNLLEALRRRGYAQGDLEKIAGMNLWRVLKAAESQAG